MDDVHDGQGEPEDEEDDDPISLSQDLGMNLDLELDEAALAEMEMDRYANEEFVLEGNSVTGSECSISCIRFLIVIILLFYN